jgi:hypothetical protein
MAYGAYYLPSLAYGTPATTLSYKECEDVQRAVIAAILPKNGNRPQRRTKGRVRNTEIGRPRARSPGNNPKLLAPTVPHRAYQEQKYH